MYDGPTRASDVTRAEAIEYLRDCFGVDSVEDIDDVLWQCIEENADAGYPVDQKLLDMKGA